MNCFYLVQKFFYRPSPEVLSSVGEDFLRCTELHIYFLEYKLCNSYLCCIRDNCRNWPACIIVNCCNYPMVPISCFGEPSNEVNTPSLEWFNISGHRQLCVL